MPLTSPDRSRRAALSLALLLAHSAPVAAEPQEQAMLDDIVDVYGLLMEFQVDAPAAIMVAVMGDASAIRTFGDDGSGNPPSEDAIFRIGSISKVMAGQVMSAMIQQDKLAPDESLMVQLPDLPGIQKDRAVLRLIDLVGQASGLPRELPVDPAPGQERDQMQTLPAIADYMGEHGLMFAPGSRLLYSNMGFQLLGAALGAANDSSYAEALAQYVTEPLGMTDTAVGLPEDKLGRLLPGHFFDGSELPLSQPGDLLGASGGVFTTARDMRRWLEWNLGNDPDPVRDRFHATIGSREDYASVSLMDESGPLDEMGVGWVIMDATPHRPRILQKAGAHGGYMAYVALAPDKRAGVFVAITEFDFDADEQMTGIANALLADLPGAMR